MTPGPNPYAGFNQQRLMGYGSGMGAYEGGMVMGSYGRYRPDTQGAVTGPTGSSSGANPEARAMGREAMLEQQARAQKTTEDMGAFRQGQNTAAAADQDKSIAAYRTARDNSQGAVDSRNERVAATQLGIDPSSSPQDIADAASVPTRMGPDGKMIGAGTQPVNMDPTQPSPASTPGQVQPNATDITNAARQVQAQKNGQADAAQATAFAVGANPTGRPATGANPFTAGIAPHATTNMAVSPLPGVPAQAASVQASPATPPAPTQATPQPPVAPTQPPRPMGDPNNTARFGPKLSGGGSMPVTSTTTQTASSSGAFPHSGAPPKPSSLPIMGTATLRPPVPTMPIVRRQNQSLVGAYQ